MTAWRRWQYQKSTEPVGVPRAVPGSQYASQWFEPLSDPQPNFTSKVRAIAGIALIASSGLFAPPIQPVLPSAVGIQWDGPIFSKTIIPQDTASGYPATVEPGNSYESSWHSPWSEPVRVKPREAYFEFYTSGVDSTLEPGQPYESSWHYPWSEPVRVKPRDAYFEFTTIYPTPEPGPAYESQGHFPWSEPVRTKLRTVEYIDHVAFQPTPIIFKESAWYQPWSEPVRTKLRDAYFETTTAGYPATIEPGSTYESPWHQPWSEPVRLKLGERPEQQQVLAFVATVAAAAEVITVDKWYIPLVDPTRRPFFQNSLQEGITSPPSILNTAATPLLVDVSSTLIFPDRVFQYQALAFTQLVTPPGVTVDTWFAPLSERSVKSLPRAVEFPALAYTPLAGVVPSPVGSQWDGPTFSKTIILQDVAFVAPFSTEIVTVDKWFTSYQDPVRVKPGLRTGDNPDLAFDPNPFIKIDWFAPLVDPNKLTKPALVIGSYPYESRNPFPLTKIDWFGWLAEPVRIKPGLASTEQQFLAFDPAVFVKIDWYEWLSEPKRLKPGLLVTEQVPFTAGFVPIIPSVTNWYIPLTEPVRFRILPPHLQQAIAFTALTNLVNVVRFSRGYIIA